MSETKTYDPSLDYVRYPTFGLMDTRLVRCTRCGCSDFKLLLPDWKPRCKHCGQMAQLPEGIGREVAPAVLPGEPEVPEVQSIGPEMSVFRPVKPELPADLPHIQIHSIGCHTVVLRADGTVLCTDPNKWMLMYEALGDVESQ